MKLIITILLLCSLTAIGQNEKNNLRTEEIKIESGEIIKNYDNDKLENFTVQIYANTYYNSFSFTKENDTIVVKNLKEKDAVIKIYVKDKKKVSEFIYKGKQIFYLEVIDFNVDNLPAKSKISNRLYGNEKTSYLYKNNLAKADGNDYEKSYKLFLFLKTSENNVTLDSIFNQIADFFSKEDAIYRIYMSKYRDKINSESATNTTAYLITDELGKIKNGILWTEKSSNNGEYHIYKNGKIIKSENINLNPFQKIINTYYIESADFNE